MEELDHMLKTIRCRQPTFEEFVVINDRLKVDVKEKTKQLTSNCYSQKFYKLCEQLETTVKLTVIASQYAIKLEMTEKRYDCMHLFLSDELLKFIQEFNKVKTVFYTPAIEESRDGWMKIAGMMLWYDEICWRTFSIAQSMLSYLFSGMHEVADYKRRILKAYSLSVTLGNPIGNSINLINPDINKPYNGMMTVNRLYNCIDGFNYNLPFLQQDIKFYMKKKFGFEFSEGEYEKAVAGTTMQKHKLLETALYLKAMTESLSIFNGMEYTPIIVNLCKAVEELETDLIAKLNERYDFNATDFRIGQGERQVFDVAQKWREEQTIGSLQAFINALNTSYFKTRGLYDKALASNIQTHFILLMSCTNIMTSNIKVKTESASDLLESYMDYWRIEIRNSHLHKDNILDADEVEKMYNDTLFLIGMLVEWYLVVSGD